MKITSKAVDTGSIALSNSLQYPFNDSMVSVRLGANAASPAYHVIVDVVSCSGQIGDIVICCKKRNGFKLGYTGSAQSAVLAYSIVDLIPDPDARTCVNAPVGSDAAVLAINTTSDSMTIDICELQDTYRKTVDVFLTSQGTLSLDDGDFFAVQVLIPAKEYNIEYGDADDFGFPRMFKHQRPLDPEGVIATIWDEEDRL